MKKTTFMIAITGTPGAGKSTFAKSLNKRLTGFKLIEINDVVEKYHTFSKIDQFNAKIVNLKVLNSAIKKEIKKHDRIILVGHLAQELEITPDVAIVVRASLKLIMKRLNARKYHKQKLRENIISEALDYCGVNMQNRCKNTLEVESYADKQSAIKYISQLSKGTDKVRKPQIAKFDKMKELKDLIMQRKMY